MHLRSIYGLLAMLLVTAVISLILPMTASAAQPAATGGVWISPEEIRQLPTSGPAWENVKRGADMSILLPTLMLRDSDGDVLAMAKGLVFAATGEAKYREEVIEACRRVQGSEMGARLLEVAKNLPGYIIAADLVGLPDEDDRRFRQWLHHLLNDFKGREGKRFNSVLVKKPNNWGTIGAAARAAMAAYLGDEEQLKEIARQFAGWMGNPRLLQAYPFRFKDLSWQYDESRPRGINPKGATKVRMGHRFNIDGVLPDDQRRAGGFDEWIPGMPPPTTNYAYTGLQGAVALAVILTRHGYDPWEWEDRALLRAFRWLYDVAKLPATASGGDDVWMLYVINHHYGPQFQAPPYSERFGKNICWTEWTHGTNR